MTRVLGLDLSLTATGVAYTDGSLDTVRPITKGDTRLLEIVGRAVDTPVEECEPELVVIEDLPHGLRNAAAGSLGMVHGAVRCALIERQVPYLTVPPATLKTYACGKGNATKPDMRVALLQRTGDDVRDDNQVDAWWLRALALDLAGQPVLELPQTHRRALDKLTFPEGANRG